MFLFSLSQICPYSTLPTAEISRIQPQLACPCSAKPMHYNS